MILRQFKPQLRFIYHKIDLKTTQFDQNNFIMNFTNGKNRAN